MTRVCGYEPCGKPLVQRVTEKPWQFRRRTCCDASCSSRRVRGSVAPIELPAVKTCVECGASMRRREKESPSRWVARLFCTRLCASRYSIRKVTPVAAVPQVKTCTGCGGDMWQRAGERVNKWRVRKFCSVACRYRQAPGVSGKAAEWKRCERCGVKFGRGKTSGKRWLARRYCGLACSRPGQAEGVRVEPSVVPSSAHPPAIPAAPVSSKPAVIWRPAGLSRIPNAWAGHRPAEPDPIEEVPA